jgi:hypothetical protein
MSDIATLAAIGGRTKNHYYSKHIGDLKARLVEAVPRTRVA